MERLCGWKRQQEVRKLGSCYNAAVVGHNQGNGKTKREGVQASGYHTCLCLPVVHRPVPSATHDVTGIHYRSGWKCTRVIRSFAGNYEDEAEVRVIQSGTHSRPL